MANILIRFRGVSVLALVSGIFAIGTASAQPCVTVAVTEQNLVPDSAGTAGMAGPSGAADWPCATVRIVSQHSVADPSGDGIICTIEMCVDPPVGGYDRDDAIFQMYPYSVAGPPPAVVGVATPGGWQVVWNPDVYWTGPYMATTVCGFAASVHVPAGLDGYMMSWSFALSYDTICFDEFYVACQPTRTVPSTWGRLKAAFR